MLLLVFFMTAPEVRSSIRQRGFDQISSIIKQIFDNHGLSEIYYKIEYGDFIYNVDFHESKEERYLDQLLRYLELVSKLYLSGQVNKDQFKLIKYEFMTVYRNEQIHKYFNFLDRIFSSRAVNEKAFPAFRQVGEIIETKIKGGGK